MIRAITESQMDKSKVLLHLEALKQIEEIQGAKYEIEEGHSLEYGKYREREGRLCSGGLTEEEIEKSLEIAKKVRKITAW